MKRYKGKLRFKGVEYFFKSDGGNFLHLYNSTDNVISTISLDSLMYVFGKGEVKSFSKSDLKIILPVQEI